MVFQDYYLNALTWRSLDHQHILPLYGVMKNERMSLFGNKEFVCGIIPWMSRGNIREHLARLRSEHALSGHAFVKAVNRLVRLINSFLAFSLFANVGYSSKAVPSVTRLTLLASRGYCAW